MNDYDKQIELLAEKRVAEILRGDPHKVIEIYKKSNEELQLRVAEMKPKAEFYDAVTRCDTEFLIRDVAKVLNFKGMGQNKLFKFLREKRVLNAHNMPYQSPHVDEGRFSYKISKWVNHQTGETNFLNTPVVTSKGKAYILKLLQEAGYVLNDR